MANGPNSKDAAGDEARGAVSASPVGTAPITLYKVVSPDEAAQIRQHGFRDDTEAETRGEGKMRGMVFSEREPLPDDGTVFVRVIVPEGLISGCGLASSQAEAGAREFLLPATLLNGPFARITFGRRYDYIINVDAAALLKDQFEGVLLIRLGSIVNAMLALSRAIPAPPYDKQKNRDAVQIGALLAGHLCELARMLNKGNGAAWTLIEKGVKAGRHIPQLDFFGKKTRFGSVDDVKTALSPGSPLLVQAEHMRDKLAFHRDDGPFRDWLKRRTDAKVTLLSLRGPSLLDIVFDTSYDVVLDSISETERPEFMDTLAELFPLCGYLVDAAIVGFAVEKGYLTLEPEAPGIPAKFRATTP